MGIPKSKPMPFTPRGLCDAFDSTNAFPGACQALTNLVFDQSNPEYVVPRPGVVTLSDLAALGFNAPTFISVQVAIGTRIYGMVATSRFPGREEPFCIDTAGNVNVPISGVTSANTPIAAGTTGDWTPPTMANVGIYVLITHPNFDGVAHYFGAINTSTMAWSSPNLATNPLPFIPLAVANFNNRAWFAWGNNVAYTDVLAPLTRTNASQQLTIGDSNSVVALAGLPLQTSSSGIIGSLMVYKATQIWQVTGDTTTSSLALNYLSLTIGSSSPRTIAQSPAGQYFLGNGGPYFIDPVGTVRALTNDAQSAAPDVNVPFQNAVNPSRWAGAYAANIYRVCGPTVIRGRQVTNDYWFDEHRRRWTGPHSFAYDCASVLGKSFVLTSANYNGLLTSCAAQPGGLSQAYTDLNTPFSFTLQSATLPKTGDMLTKQVVESQIELGDATTYTITAQDESGATMDQVNMTTVGSNPPLWGGFVWGDGTLWTSSLASSAKTYAVPWHVPLNFEKMQVTVQGTVSAKVQIGTFMARYQETGYMTTNAAVSA